jgi:hypothetical protein
MKSPQAKYRITTCVTIVMMLLLDGCASSLEKDVVTEDRTVAAEEIRCPAGYTKVCEAKKVGRIRFGRIGNDNLDSCACEPQDTGRPAKPVIPSIP